MRNNRVPEGAHPAIFMDRDGTLNEMVFDDTHGLLDSPRTPEQVRLVKGAALAMRRFRDEGYRIVVVTNQPGIAKGTLDEYRLASVNNRLAELLATDGAYWDALYFCPHHPREGVRRDLVVSCDCRKPAPGLLLRAAHDLDLSMADSWMIGDGIVDIGAGCAAGCRTALLSTLKLEVIERFVQMDIVPDLLADNYAELLRAFDESARNNPFPGIADRRQVS